MRTIPHTNLTITQFGIGTATFGGQVDKEEAFKMLDIGTKEYGLNFIVSNQVPLFFLPWLFSILYTKDTSEADPLPHFESTKHQSEKFVGSWLKKQSQAHRDQIVLSTKICGHSDHVTWLRPPEDGSTKINRKQVIEAVDGQLKRLNVDCIDLLQFQWPERYVANLGALDYDSAFEHRQTSTFVEQLEIVDTLVKAGKVKHFGLSNETPYGIGKFCALAEALSLPRPVSLQTPYNLLDRFEYDHSLREAVSPMNEHLGLITYAPLAGGVLSGKYEINEKLFLKLLQTYRLIKYPGYQHRYLNPKTKKAMKVYLAMAQEAQLPLQLLALGFVISHPDVLTTLLGASTTAQLVQNIHSINCVPLDPRAMQKIDQANALDFTSTMGPVALHDVTLRHQYRDLSKEPFGFDEEDMDEEEEELLDEVMKRQERITAPPPPVYMKPPTKGDNEKKY